MLPTVASYNIYIRFSIQWRLVNKLILIFLNIIFDAPKGRFQLELIYFYYLFFPMAWRVPWVADGGVDLQI